MAAACVCSSISVGTAVTHLFPTHGTPVPQSNGTQVLPTQAFLAVCTNLRHSLPAVLLVAERVRLSLDGSLAVRTAAEAQQAVWLRTVGHPSLGLLQVSATVHAAEPVSLTLGTTKRRQLHFCSRDSI